MKLVGKDNKAKIVPLMESDVIILRQYMIKNRLLEDSANQKPLFYNARKEKLTLSGLHQIFRYFACEARKKASDIIPDKKLSCHSLRHYKAFHLLQVGVNSVYIRDILGHQSVKTTEIYARTDSNKKGKFLKKPIPMLLHRWFQLGNIIRASWISLKNLSEFNVKQKDEDAFI